MVPLTHFCIEWRNPKPPRWTQGAFVCYVSMMYDCTTAVHTVCPASVVLQRVLILPSAVNVSRREPGMPTYLDDVENATMLRFLVLAYGGGFVRGGVEHFTIGEHTLLSDEKRF